MTHLSFTKMHGLGNDFMVISTLHQTVSLNPDHIRLLADRHKGVGFDQLMLINPSKNTHADFAYQIFNADGSEVEQCGNGVRCVAQFIHEKKLSEKKILRLESLGGIMICQLCDDQQVSVDMGKPNFDPAVLPFLESISRYYELPYQEHVLSFGAVSMGNPHAVFKVPDVTQAEVNIWGAFLNQHASFPRGVNVGFMQIINKHHIRLRVYERGATETLACGTGACAAVSVGQLWGMLDKNVDVDLPGGRLHISQDENGHIHMQGEAIFVFDGELK